MAYRAMNLISRVGPKTMMDVSIISAEHHTQCNASVSDPNGHKDDVLLAACLQPFGQMGKSEGHLGLSHSAN